MTVEHRAAQERPQGRSTTRTLLALLALLALLVTACAGGDAGDGDAGGDAAADGDGGEGTEPAEEQTAATEGTEGPEPVTLTLGLIPSTDIAPVYLGIREGFFEAEGLTIEPQMAQGGAAVTPAVISGEYPIGLSNPTSLVLARAQDLPVKIIAGGTSGGTDEEDGWAWMVVAEDSPVQSPTDLEGRTVAINTLRNILEITVKESLENAGVDVSAVEFVEIPFPDMSAALSGGQVDAVVAVEPFVTQALEAGGRRLFNPYENVIAELPSAVYFTTEEYLASNADVVERFRRAMSEASRYAAENPDEVRGIVTEYTQIAPEVAQQMRLPVFQETVEADKLRPHVDLSVKYGLIPEAIDAEDLVAP